LLLDASAPPGSTVGGDKNFDTRAFVTAVRALEITPHVAQKMVGPRSTARRKVTRGMPSANRNGS
jgi:hypothetical protein